MDERNDTDTVWQRVTRLLELNAAWLLAEARRLSGLLALSDEEPADVVQEFTLEKLPSVVSHAEQLSLGDAETGRYVRASFRNFLRDRARRARVLRHSWEALREELRHGDPQEDTDRRVEEDPLQLRNFPLPQPHQQALARFFGLGVEARSIREIAKELSVSRHAARLLVLDGVLAITAALGHRAVLTDRQSEACRLVLVEGLSWNDAADRLGITEHQARKAVREARRAFEHLLIQPGASP